LPNTECRILRCFGFIGLFFLICFCAFLFPQNKNTKREASPKSRSTYRVKVNAVVINATVTDKSGNPVTDLTAHDFKLYEDGKPQTIQTFAQESIDPLELEKALISGASPQPKREAQVKRAAPKQNAERPPRLISIVIDDLTMESATGANRRPGSILDFPRMVTAAKKFITTDLSPADQVAILSGSRNVQFPFTDDKTRLLEELDAVPRKLNTISALRDQEKYAISDGEAWAIANGSISDPPFVDQAKAEWKRTLAIRQNADLQSRTRNLLYTILLHLRVLSHFEGPKMVVLFSDGFITEPGELTGAVEAHELQELIDMALHSGIILNAISTRGITAEGIISTQDFSTPTPFSAFAINAQQQQQMRAQEQHDQEQDQLLGVGTMPDDTPMQEKPMAQLAAETGGAFFPRGNDMYPGLRTIAHRRHSYYVLTYTMPPHKPDGAYHYIKLEVTRPGLKISYRKGYYSPTEELTFENSNREDLMAALHGPGNMNEIPITLSYSSSQEDDSTCVVSFITNVNIRKLRFPEENNRRRNQISLVLAAFDETDHFINGLEKSIDFQLLENNYTDLLRHGLTSRVELKLPIGRYRIKAVVRENSQGKMGSIAEPVEIP
jgi:VWFA-related protein